MYLANFNRTLELSKKLFFTLDDVSDAFNIKSGSAAVLCSRYVKSGIFVRLKNDLYVPGSRWEDLSTEEYFRISNFLQTPSYVSFLSALSYYGISTQLQRNVFECTSLKRSRKFEIKDSVFNYYKIRHELYLDFEKLENIFIGTPEKALVDSLYMQSIGRYSLDISAIDLEKLDRKKLEKILKNFPEKTKNLYKLIAYAKFN